MPPPVNIIEYSISFIESTFYFNISPHHTYGFRVTRKTMISAAQPKTGHGSGDKGIEEHNVPYGSGIGNRYKYSLPRHDDT